MRLLIDTYTSSLPLQNLLASVERVCMLHTYNGITIKYNIMSVKVNEKGVWPKVCCGCEIELNPGVNCYLSMYKRGSYKCKSCKKQQSKVEHKRYWEMPSYRQKKADYIKEYHDSDGAGVYAIYENDECIYIGESQKVKSRITSHFSKHIKSNTETYQQPIQLDLKKGILDRTKLSYDILEQVDDKLIRQTRETHYIKEHIAKHGEAPRYNIYKTSKKRMAS